jgi:hypothetical protein
MSTHPAASAKIGSAKKAERSAATSIARIRLGGTTKQALCRLSYRRKISALLGVPVRWMADKL